MKGTPMAEKLDSAIAVMGIDIGKNSFHAVGLDECGAIVRSIPFYCDGRSLLPSIRAGSA